MLDPIRGAVWNSNVNTMLGTLFLAVCALWAAIVIFEAAWHVNPVTNAFAAVIEGETQPQ